MFNRLDRLHQGIFLVVTAVACFGALDTAVKYISHAVPLVMAIWFRYLFQALVTSLTLLPSRGAGLLRTRHPGLQLLRAALLVVVSALAFLSLRHVPVGEFTAILMLTPLLVTLLAVTSLGERVSAMRWLFVFGGFVGALLVIRPGSEDFTWAMLLPLLLVASNAWFQIITSRLSRLEDASTTQVYTGVIGAGLATIALPFGWQSIEQWTTWTILLFIGAASTFGHLMLIKAYSRAPASSLTPYLYAQIAFATLGGWLVFAHTPDAWSLVGILIIAACGAIGTWLKAREDRLARASVMPAAPPARTDA